jgi:hypothetical protein
MASNKKWFKRALRSLSYGDNELWKLIKTKLKTEQIEYFEKEFAPEAEETLKVEEKISVLDSRVKIEPKTTKKKATSKKKTTTKNKTVKKITKSKEK